MMEKIEIPPSKGKRKSFSGMQVLGIVAASTCIAFVATTIAIKIFLFPPPFKPVTLSQDEEVVLAAKLEAFEGIESAPQQSQSEFDSDGNLKPEQYSEETDSREINFTERELNAMVAKNTDLADKVAIDLAQDMVSVKLLIPMDPDFPILGGKTLKVKAGAELAYREGRPVVKLKGVSLMGVPMPNAWLGGVKNIDLMNEFGNDGGFWKSFADGVESIDVVEGSLKIELKE
jgi:hypothetical protein